MGQGAAYHSLRTKGKGRHIMYEFRNVRGHIEVYDQRGQFLFSADSEREARKELDED